MERGKNGGKRNGVCFTSMRHRPLRNARPSRKNSDAAPPRRWVVGFLRHVLRPPPGARGRIGAARRRRCWRPHGDYALENPIPPRRRGAASTWGDDSVQRKGPCPRSVSP
jgi:hypothetical protein